MARAALPLALGLIAWGCAAGWDVDALAARSPGLAGLPGHRLGDATPYALPVAGELIWFLCHFETREPIRVALPPDASPAERALLELALHAWQQALGVRFAEAEPAEIEIAFAADDADFAATTEADCRVERAAHSAGETLRLPARLAHAAVELRRAQLDARGHRIALDEAQQLGAALHELGHALGYAGHAKGGDTVMVRTVESVRDAGRRVLAGQPFRDDTLAALYRVEPGAVVARSALPAGRSGPVDRLAALSDQAGDGSLLVRAGDRRERIAFVDAEGNALRVFLRNPREALRDPARLELAADEALLRPREDSR